MKRLFIFFIVLTLIFTIPTFVFAQDISIVVDGTTRIPDVAPQIINGRTMVPVRFIAELFGCEVSWDDITHSVIINTNKGIASGSEFKIEVLNYAISTSYEDQPCIVVHYKFTNNSKETVSYSGSMMTTKAFQNGIELESTSVKYKSLYDKFDDATWTEIRPGYSLEMAEAFVINNTTSKIDFEFIDYSLAWNWELNTDGVIARSEYNFQ